MGYTTRFDGVITVDPPASTELILNIAAFCKRYHKDSSDPSAWCDWELTNDGKSLRWNGREKSYNMCEWLDVLITKFFIYDKYLLNGSMLAVGERIGDLWMITVHNNVTTTSKVSVNTIAAMRKVTLDEMKACLDMASSSINMDSDLHRLDLASLIMRSFNVMVK